MLDLTVKMININPHEHHELLKRCKVMREYGQFVDTVRKYQRLGYQDACKHAVEECIHQGILSEYLKKKGSEVVNMLIAEYDYDLDIEVQREEAYEEGRKAGRKVGERDKLIELTQKKLAKGKSIEEIADELEEKPEDIQDICNQIKEGKL